MNRKLIIIFICFFKGWGKKKLEFGNSPPLMTFDMSPSRKKATLMGWFDGPTKDPKNAFVRK